MLLIRGHLRNIIMMLTWQRGVPPYSRFFPLHEYVIILSNRQIFQTRASIQSFQLTLTRPFYLWFCQSKYWPSFSFYFTVTPMRHSYKYLCLYRKYLLYQYQLRNLWAQTHPSGLASSLENPFFVLVSGSDWMNWERSWQILSFSIERLELKEKGRSTAAISVHWKVTNWVLHFVAHQANQCFD